MAPRDRGLNFLSRAMTHKGLAWLKSFPIEAVIWTVALLVLALSDPAGTHIAICPLQRLGVDFCPGCGLGRSVTLLFHGEVTRSFAAHPLGIFAVIVLSLRVVTLLKLYYKSYGQDYRRSSRGLR